MAGQNDGTTVASNADLVSTEDMTGRPRGTADAPQLGTTAGNYKLGRSKIAVGGYGADQGDASFDSPLPVGMRAERQQLELIRVREMDASLYSLMTRGQERVQSIFGARGSSDRGQR